MFVSLYFWKTGIWKMWKFRAKLLIGKCCHCEAFTPPPPTFVRQGLSLFASLLVRNVRMLFVLIFCSWTMSDSEKEWTLKTVDWSAYHTCICCRERGGVWGSTHAGKACCQLCAHHWNAWLRLTNDTKSLMFSAYATCLGGWSSLVGCLNL